MDEKVQLNAELIGKPYDANSEVSLWVTTAASKMGMSLPDGFGGKGMLFRKTFDQDSLKLVVDEQTYSLKGGVTPVTGSEYPKVSKDLMRKIAKAQSVKVSVTANGGSLKFESDFNKKNFVKMQEFVQEYIDPNQKVERSFFLLRWFHIVDY
jgi:hypothetical protein